MYCPKCGQQNADENKFCLKCGEALIKTASVAQETPTPQRPVEAEAPRNSGLAVASLVLGIVGFFFNLLAVLAIIFGAVAIGQITKNPELKGRGMAIAGLVLGIIVVAGWILIMLIFGSFFWWASGF